MILQSLQKDTLNIQEESNDEGVIMFKDASGDTKEAKSELNNLPDEVVDGDGADELPDEIGLGDETKGMEKSVIMDASETEKSYAFSDLVSMKKELDKTYREIKEDKPPNSPNIAKWFDNGGFLRIEETDGKKVWTYIDKEGREVSYIDGYPVFPPEAKHLVIDDINIGEFTGDRNEDKQLYLEKLEELYGLTQIPEGYELHHDSKNGNMQLIKTDWHKEFTHAGGHSLFKEVE